MPVPPPVSVRLRVLEGSLQVLKSPVAADREPAWVVIVVCGRVPWNIPWSVPAEFRSYPLLRCGARVLAFPAT